jgi:thioredoxin-dependent peroxiredoxin
MTTAPDATLITQDGQPITISSLWAKGSVLLIFYPRNETRVCTAQLCDYRDRLSEFTALGVQVIGINPDSASQHQQFAHAHGFTFPLFSDPDRSCARAYGAAAWWGTRRLTVLIDQHGHERWRLLVNPFTRPSADTLLLAVKQQMGQK